MCQFVNWFLRAPSYFWFDLFTNQFCFCLQSPHGKLSPRRFKCRPSYCDEPKNVSDAAPQERAFKRESASNLWWFLGPSTTHLLTSQGSQNNLPRKYYRIVKRIVPNYVKNGLRTSHSFPKLPWNLTPIANQFLTHNGKSCDSLSGSSMDNP